MLATKADKALLYTIRCHLAISKQVSGTHDTRRHVWWVGGAADNAQNLVGKSQACLRYILWLQWCLAHETVGCIQRHNAFAAYTWTDLSHVRISNIIIIIIYLFQ